MTIYGATMQVANPHCQQFGIVDALKHKCVFATRQERGHLRRKIAEKHERKQSDHILGPFGRPRFGRFGGRGMHKNQTKNHVYSRAERKIPGSGSTLI